MNNKYSYIFNFKIPFFQTRIIYNPNISKSHKIS